MSERHFGQGVQPDLVAARSGNCRRAAAHAYPPRAVGTPAGPACELCFGGETESPGGFTIILCPHDDLAFCCERSNRMRPRSGRYRRPLRSSAATAC